MIPLPHVAGDGHIDMDEYVALYTALGLSADQCREAFRRVQKVSVLGYPKELGLPLGSLGKFLGLP